MSGNDPEFAKKDADIVGLYLNLPVHAAVFFVDEKTAIQPLNRTQQGLPVKKGRAQTLTHALHPNQHFVAEHRRVVLS